MYEEGLLLYKSPRDWRVLFDIEVVDGTLVAVLRHAVRHGIEYRQIYSEGRSTSPVERLSHNDLRRMLADPLEGQRHRELKVATAAVRRLDDQLRSWLQAPGPLQTRFYGTRRVRERSSFSELVASLDMASRRDLHADLFAKLGPRFASGHLVGKGWKATSTESSVELFADSATEDDPIRRVYSSGLLERDRRDMWMHLAGIRDPSLDPSLPFDEAEFAVLDAIRDPYDLPALVHGPAGSGKSTVLSNFLAHLIDKAESSYADGRAPSPQVRFVTYSPQLASDTAARVTNHLVVHYGHSERHASAAAAAACCSWRQLLDEVGGDSATPQNVIGFADFLGWFGGRVHRSQRRIPPRTAWWVLRSLLRGASLLGKELPEDLDELPRSLEGELARRADACGIEASTLLRLVRENVLPPYEAWLVSSGQEDDQAAASRVLKKLSAEGRGVASAIVCDEVQDFTLLQLQTLGAMLHQRHFELGGELGGLPLIFAGDPDQDINQSGFRWGSFRGMLGHVLASAGRPPKVAEQHHLTVNHRCQANIVAVAESVRRLLPESTGKQTPSRAPGSGVVVLDLETQTELATNLLSKADVLVPLAEGQDVQEAMGNPDADRAMANRSRVWSPLLAKGLEFSAVVVYGFSAKATAQAADDDLAALYVAVTRPRDHLLFVEDTPADAERLRQLLDLEDGSEDPYRLAREIIGATDDLRMGLESLRAALDQESPDLAVRARDRLLHGGASPSDVECAARVAESLQGRQVPPPGTLPQGEAANEVATWALDTENLPWLSACSGLFSRLVPSLSGSPTPDSLAATVTYLGGIGRGGRHEGRFREQLADEIVFRAERDLFSPEIWEEAESLFAHWDDMLSDAWAWCALGVDAEAATLAAVTDVTRWRLALEIARLRELEGQCPADRVDWDTWSAAMLQAEEPLEELITLWVVDRVLEAAPPALPAVLDHLVPREFDGSTALRARCLSRGLEAVADEFPRVLQRGRRLADSLAPV